MIFLLTFTNIRYINKDMEEKYIYPNDKQYRELLISFGYHNPAWYPKCFVFKDDCWNPVL